MKVNCRVKLSPKELNVIDDNIDSETASSDSDEKEEVYANEEYENDIERLENKIDTFWTTLANWIE